MKLTKKDYCGYDIKNRKSNTDYTCEEIFNVVQKLGKLEDDLEELENTIPLQVVSKIFLSIMNETELTIYIKGKTKIMECYLYAIRDGNVACLPYNNQFNFPYNKRIKDYKKTWWLKEDKSE